MRQFNKYLHTLGKGKPWLNLGFCPKRHDQLAGCTGRDKNDVWLLGSNQSYNGFLLLLLPTTSVFVFFSFIFSSQELVKVSVRMITLKGNKISKQLIKGRPILPECKAQRARGWGAWSRLQVPVERLRLRVLVERHKSAGHGRLNNSLCLRVEVNLK